jgi:hypothetical protein
MKTTSPIIATVIFAAAAALLVAGALSLPLGLLRRPATLNLALFLCLGAYAPLLARKSRTPIRALAGPLLLLAAVLPVAASAGGFALPAATGLAWIRSAICFRGPLARRLVAETLTAAAGLAVCAGLRPPGVTGWVLAVWMFFLIQALYFVIVEAPPVARGEPPARHPRETLRRRAQALLREQKLENAFAELQLSVHPRSDK